MENEQNVPSFRDQCEEYLRSIGATEESGYHVADTVEVTVYDAITGHPACWHAKVYLPESDHYPVDQLNVRGYTLESLKRFVSMTRAEASTAVLRQALRKIAEHPSVISGACGDRRVINPGDLQVIACDTLNATNAGQSLLDRIAALEEQNARLLKEREGHVLISADLGRRWIEEGDKPPEFDEGPAEGRFARAFAALDAVNLEMEEAVRAGLGMPPTGRSPETWGGFMGGLTGAIQEGRKERAGQALDKLKEASTNG